MGLLRDWFDKTLDPDSHRRDTDGLYRLFVTAGVAVLVVFAATLYFGKQGDPGPWGDFFGGFLNPILTFVTFMGVLATILLQHRELKESRTELARSATALANQNEIAGRQLFESSFFQMLSLHNDIVSQIDLNVGNGKEKRGRDCFNNFLRNLQSSYESEKRRSDGDEQEVDIICRAYAKYWTSKNVELGHYYRYLFNIVRYISDHPSFLQHHGKILRSQLSDQELVLLFYNGLTDQGRAFTPYALRLDLFDNLSMPMLLDASHSSLVPRPVD